MDSFFVERSEGGLYRIAMIDRHKIFNSENPERLATSFDSSEANPSKKDRAQIFFAIGQAIGATDFFKDLFYNNNNYKLNTWTVFVANNNGSTYLSPLTRDKRILLYSKTFSITPTEEELSVPLHLNLPNNAQVWKTGILQRCFKCLLLEEHHLPRVYSLLDEQYRRVMRWKLETEGNTDNILVQIIKEITKLLGLKHSRDVTPFNNIFEEVNVLCERFAKVIGKELPLSVNEVLNMWVNSTITSIEGKFKLDINPDITEVLNCMVPMLVCPDKLLILEAPL